MKNTMIMAMSNGQSASGYIPDTDSFSHETFQVLGSKLMPGSCAELNTSSTFAELITEYQIVLNGTSS